MYSSGLAENMFFFGIFFAFTFIKSVFLAVLLYHDLSYDPLVLYLLVNSPISVILLYWRNNHTLEKDVSKLNVVNSAFYVMRTLAIFFTGMLWEHHSYREAVFADMFLAVTIVDILIAISGGVSPKTYKNLDEMYENRRKVE